MTPASQLNYIDQQAERFSPTSRFLLRSEFGEILPEVRQNRLNFIFRHNIPLRLDPRVGRLLIKKYPSILREDFLEGLNEDNLRRLANKRGFKHKDLTGEELIIQMREAEDVQS